MSWSIDAVIKAKGEDVLGKVKARFDAVKLDNAEERNIKDQICQVALAALAGNTAGFIKLEASGSAYSAGDASQQTCRLSVQPIYGSLIE